MLRRRQFRSLKLLGDGATGSIKNCLAAPRLCRGHCASMMSICQRHTNQGTTFHPTFLYESMWTLGLSLWLVRLSGSPRFAGSRLFALYVSGYGLGRLWIEGLRIDDASVIGGLRWNQWVAIASIVGGLIYLAMTSSSGDSAEEVDVQQAATNGDR